MRDGGDPLVLLAEAAQRGSTSAFDELLKQLAKSVRTVIRNVLGSSRGCIEPMVREALARVRDALPHMDPNDVEAEAIEIARQAAVMRLVREWGSDVAA